MKFTDRLHRAVRPIWQASHNHPFVQGIADGTLPVEKFRFYMCQDYVYLIDYSKLFALASIKATDVAMMGRFADLLASTLNVEMDLHRQYAEKFQISRAELESTEPAPITLAYAKYMLDVAHHGALAELVSSLLPCMWSYWEIGKRLALENRVPADSLYQEWIDMYSSPKFGDLAQWLIDVMNQLAEGLPESHLRRLEQHFVTTSRYEYLFWDMAYKLESWPKELMKSPNSCSG